MKIFVPIFLSALVSVALGDKSVEVSSHQNMPVDTPALLCADQANNRIRLINPLVRDGNATLWCYPRAGGKPIKYRPTDAKRVKFNGEVCILIAYHRRVRLVRFSDSELLKDYSTYDSCHSAELLPDGSIVSVSSNHGVLRLHHSADQFIDLKMPDAHGVTWDKERKCLWVLGDCLYRFHYTAENLSFDHKFELPLSSTGHELFPLRNESKLLVSNNDALFLFDIKTEEFEVVSKLKEIKSASQQSDGSIWVSDPKKIKGAANWQSDAVISVFPKKLAMRYAVPGARFYKARWWQEVNFSY